MKRGLVVVLLIASALAACKKEDNPLMAASDGQFSRLIEPKNAFSPPCAAALYEPDAYIVQYNGLKFSPDARIHAVSEQQRSECYGELQKRASEIGIVGNVTAENLKDERVKQRYLAARKK
jgi:hypothetical protein